MASNEQRGKEALSNLERELDSRDRKEKSRPWSVAALSAVAIALIGGGIYVAANQGDEDNLATDDTSAASETDNAEQEEFDASTFAPIATKREKALPATVSCTYENEDGAELRAGTPPTENVSTEGTVTVELETNQGPIGMTLDRAASPCTVNAIEYLVKEKYYDDTVCHRLTSGGINVLQCGDPSGTGAGGPGFQFPDEYPVDDDAENTNQSVIYERGTVAMANSGPDTNGSQFFLNYGESPLAPAYTYFGTINEEGLATLDKIAEAGIAEDGQSAMGSGDGAPKEEVKIKKATIS